MSAILSKADVTFTQRLLCAAGFLPANGIDGAWGPNTQAAVSAWDNAVELIAKECGRYDARSEVAIATLLPKAQRAARACLAATAGTPYYVRILSGTRSYAEQDQLFRQRPKVTNARGGQSNHNFGIAWDIGIFVDGNYYTGATAKQERAYDEVAALVKNAVPGIEWGGDWKSFKDKPHYQLATGKSAKQCRVALETGKPYC